MEENKNETVKKLESISSLEPLLEKQETFEAEEKTFKEEVVRDMDELKKEDEKVSSIEQSVSLADMGLVSQLENELQVKEQLSDLNNQAEVLKNTTEEYAEWLKLEDHTFDEESFYRIVDEKGYKDFQENKIIRSSPTGTDSKMHGRFDLGHRPTPFPSFDKGAPNLTYARSESDNYVFESKFPMYKKGDINPVTGNEVRSGHWAYRPIHQETGKVITQMTPDMVENIYKVDKEGNLYLKNKD